MKTSDDAPPSHDGSALLPRDFLHGALDELVSRAPPEQQHSLQSLRNDLRQRRRQEPSSRNSSSSASTSSKAKETTDAPVAALRNPLSNEPPPATRHAMRILALLIVFRVYNALTIASFYVPDEYYQSLEVAYYAVFGHGYLTWEWRPNVQLRGFSHPLLFAGVYKLLQWLKLDHTGLLIGLPKMVQGLLAALADFWTYKLAHETLGYSTARWTLACSLISWYNWYALPRTLANSIETTTSAAALYYWTKNFLNLRLDAAPQVSFVWALMYTAVTIVLRPSAFPTFVVAVGMFGVHFVRWAGKQPAEIRRRLLLRASIIFTVQMAVAMVLALFTSIAIDSIAYAVLSGSSVSDASWAFVRTLVVSAGLIEWLPWLFDESAVAMPVLKLVFPPWNFVRFNVTHALSAFYGTNLWHWYLSSALTAISATLIPATLYGAWQLAKFTRNQQELKEGEGARRTAVWCLLVTFGATVLMFSLLAHKEFRFLAGIMPILFLVTGFGLHTASRKVQTLGATAHTPPTQQQQQQQNTATQQQRRPRLKAHWYLSLVALLVTQSLAGWYLSCVYQRGVVDVMHWIRAQATQAAHKGPADAMAVYFMMPCHSTPYYSYVGRPIRMGFLTCEPPLSLSEKQRGKSQADTLAAIRAYRDEADRFYDNVPGSLAQWQWTHDKWHMYLHAETATRETADSATHIVLFDVLWSAHNHTGVLQEYKEPLA
ncbi:glycosylphosphatidylinositol anchor biosynthesis [Sorochytrium milnesiophthora]